MEQSPYRDPFRNSSSGQHQNPPSPTSAESAGTSETVSIPSTNTNTNTNNSPSDKFAPIRTNESPRNDSAIATATATPTLTRQSTAGGRPLTQNEISSALAHRTTSSSYKESSDDTDQVVRLVSRMFGHDRKANSDEEQTRHVGVVWKNLTVKGVGLGAALQPTNADIFLGLPRLVRRVFTKGRNGGGAPLRTILDDFTVFLLSFCCILGLD